MIPSTVGARLGALVAGVAVLAALGSGAGADSIERGHIVRIEDREIYFTIASSTPLKRGDALRIKRPIKLKHPVSGKMVTDWLPLGTASATMVGKALGMAVLEDDLLAQVQVGDLVESLVLDSELPPEPEDEPITPPELQEPVPAESLPDVDPHTREMLAVWRGTSGQRIEVRIGAWEDFLVKHPSSPYAAAIQEDLEILRAHRDKLRPPELELDESFSGGLEHQTPTRGRSGEALELAFLVDLPNLAAAWLHYRVRGSSSFSKAVLHREGADYLRGAIPASAVQGPGVEYFVEVATQRGAVGTAVGTPDSPVFVEVAEPAISEVFTQKRNRSRISLTSAFLDFATFDDRTGDHTDAYFMFEADFLYRIRRTLYGVRTGFGVINGQGGYADREWDAINVAPRAGFNYGYAELEFRGKYQTAVRGRVVAGVGKEGFGLGAEGYFRLGAEDRTNLSLGVSTVEEIGFLTDIRMQWDAVKNFPLGLAVALTDRPNRGDLGVRLTTDIGYRALSWVQPTLRVSYQARTVVHAGVGIGLGLVFDW